MPVTDQDRDNTIRSIVAAVKLLQEQVDQLAADNVDLSQRLLELDCGMVQTDNRVAVLEKKGNTNA